MVMILVAEGEGRSRRMLRRFLEGQGMTTRGASTLEEPVELEALPGVEVCPPFWEQALRADTHRTAAARSAAKRYFS